jgi:hypothetical protein
MTSSACAATGEELLAYWLGELAEGEERRLDEHLLGCGACSARLGALVELGAAIRRVALGGELGFVASAALVGRLKGEGLRVREYTLEPGGSVDCTIAPEDDLVVSHLRAPLHGVSRLDVVIDDSTRGAERVSDVAFDPAAGGVSIVPSAAYLRALGNARQHVTLLAVDDSGERAIAGYTFNHSPTRRSGPS